MDIVVSPASRDPIYKQIFDQLSSQIMSGSLKGGECLPPIRTVAKELEISVITVKRAWEELERQGLICTVTGKGCFVAVRKKEELETKRLTLAKEKLAADAEYYRTLGLTREELVDLIERFY